MLSHELNEVIVLTLVSECPVSKHLNCILESCDSCSVSKDLLSKLSNLSHQAVVYLCDVCTYTLDLNIDLVNLLLELSLKSLILSEEIVHSLCKALTNTVDLKIDSLILCLEVSDKVVECSCSSTDELVDSSILSLKTSKLSVNYFLVSLESSDVCLKCSVCSSDLS